MGFMSFEKIQKDKLQPLQYCGYSDKAVFLWIYINFVKSSTQEADNRRLWIHLEYTNKENLT